jgi:Na+/H+-translocating membrane pyrophosphatase
MENPTVSKSSVSFGLALAIACIVNAILVVVKEKSDTVMNGMKKLTGHHWITHTVIVLAVFILFGMANKGQGMKVTASRLICTVIGGVVTAGLIIVGFYLFAD